MREFFKPSSLLVIFLISHCLLPVADNGRAEEFIPPVPDKAKTLPANDGGPDGCNSSRFECVMGGQAVLDKQTGLVWARDAGFDKKRIPWDEALKFCESVEIGGKQGWRLPTRDEFISLLDTSQGTPALPEGHPFILVGIDEHGGAGGQSYWTSTEYEEDSQSVWEIRLQVGKVCDTLKFFDAKVWPVRDAE